MPQLELLKKTVKALEEIPYMLTGSVVSSFHGIPNSTHDINIIISITQNDISKIIEEFPSDFY